MDADAGPLSHELVRAVELLSDALDRMIRFAVSRLPIVPLDDR